MHQSFQLPSAAVTSSKSVSDTPLATKRGPQWEMAEATRASVMGTFQVGRMLGADVALSHARTEEASDIDSRLLLQHRQPFAAPPRWRDEHDRRHFRGMAENRPPAAIPRPRRRTASAAREHRRLHFDRAFRKPDRAGQDSLALGVSR